MEQDRVNFQQQGWDAKGIEPSPRAAGFAREHYGLDVFCGDLLDYAEADGTPTFDAIHSAQVLEHVLEPEACVARIVELLAPGQTFRALPDSLVDGRARTEVRNASLVGGRLVSPPRRCQ